MRGLAQRDAGRQVVQRRRLDIACLKGRADTEVSHDNYFHSVLGLMDVQTSVYQKPLDVYAPCRRTVRP